MYEGFWWSHMGWLLDDQATQSRVFDTSNAKGACMCALVLGANVLLVALLGTLGKRAAGSWATGMLLHAALNNRSAPVLTPPAPAAVSLPRPLQTWPTTPSMPT